MQKREQAAKQQMTDAEWRTLAPKVWDVVPHFAYDWTLSRVAEAKLQRLVSCDQMSFSKLDPLARNQALRDVISPRLASANVADLYLLSNWIIRDWGGIKGGPRDDKKDPLLTWAEELAGFEPATVEAFIMERGLDRVSSWSKLLAFADSDRYAIYDARVAVTLNIALRAVGERHQFHVPVGRKKVVIRAAGALGSVTPALGYRDYLSLLRALVSERGLTLIAAETTLFSAAPHLAGRLMVELDEYLAEACSISCAP